MVRKFLLLIIILLAVLLMVWSVRELVSHIQLHLYQQSVSRGLSQEPQPTSLLALLLSDIYTYIAAAVAIFISSVIRFYTNLLC